MVYVSWAVDENKFAGNSANRAFFSKLKGYMRENNLGGKNLIFFLIYSHIVNFDV